MSDSVPLLSVRGLHVGYGHIPVLHGIDLEVAAGEIVTVIGSNGAGKSTLLKALVGLARVTQGSITFDGIESAPLKPERLLRAGVALVPEGRMLFGPMSVRENLELGAYSSRKGRQTAVSQGLERVYRLFPVLESRESQVAETLSGGEQQMLAIGRGSASRRRSSRRSSRSSTHSEAAASPSSLWSRTPSSP
jgi:branched-chain amino acid transport system ATP-binding protein